MGFWALFQVATMPVLQDFIISVVGAFLASGYCNILTSDARKYINKMIAYVLQQDKIVQSGSLGHGQPKWEALEIDQLDQLQIAFIAFTPSLTFASLAQSVTFQDIISWWFMPINIGLTFFFGSALGWVAVKLLKPEPRLEGIVIATCSAANLGNLPLILIPAICREHGTPFGNRTMCNVRGLSYASFSMALGGLYIWTFTFHLVRSSSIMYHRMQYNLSNEEATPKVANTDFDSGRETDLLKPEGEESYDHLSLLSPSVNKTHSSGQLSHPKESFFKKLKGILQMIVEELLAPPTTAAIFGFVFGAIPWLKSLITGDYAPFRVIQDSINLLGHGTIPCTTLILGGNLTQGLKSGRLRPIVIIAVIIIRFAILPVIGIGVVRAADELGFLSEDPLYQYLLMIQFSLPPAINIGTMTQLFDVGQVECSIIFLWTYLVAALALTVWSTVYMWILS